MVFDGHDQGAAWGKQPADLPKHPCHGVIPPGEHRRILQHPDEGNDVEAIGAVKFAKAIRHHRHIVQLPGSRTGDGRAPGRSLQRQHTGAALPQIPGQGPATGTDLQDILALQQPGKGTKNISPAAGEVIE